MLKKHIVLAGIVVALVLLLVATWAYPGGSQFDQHSVGFDWQNNYLSNLFGPKAVNGEANTARFFAIPGMFFLCVSFGYFFFEFSQNIASESSSRIIRYLGVGAMGFAFLAVTPLHDIAITVAGTLVLISMFYLTVFLFKTRLHALKVLSVLSLLNSYGCSFVYNTYSYLEWLPIMQKIGIALMIAWVLGLEYFTTPADFSLQQKSETQPK